MDFHEACDKLAKLLTKSQGEPILVDDEEISFNSVKKYREQDIKEFENKYHISLPESYHYFLKVVGACEAYQFHKFGSGFEVIELEKIEETSEEYGEDYHQFFPNFLL